MEETKYHDLNFNLWCRFTIPMTIIIGTLYFVVIKSIGYHFLQMKSWQFQVFSEKKQQ